MSRGDVYTLLKKPPIGLLDKAPQRVAEESPLAASPSTRSSCPSWHRSVPWTRDQFRTYMGKRLDCRAGADLFLQFLKGTKHIYVYIYIYLYNR